MADYYTTFEAAEKAGVHHSTLRKYYKVYSLGQKVGAFLLWTDSDIEKVKEIAHEGRRRRWANTPRTPRSNWPEEEDGKKE